MRYTVPSSICIDNMDERLTVRFRVGAVYKNVKIVVKAADTVLMSISKKIVAPGEMEQVILLKNKLTEIENCNEIVIGVEVQND